MIGRGPGSYSGSGKGAVERVLAMNRMLLDDEGRIGILNVLTRNGNWQPGDLWQAFFRDVVGLTDEQVADIHKALSLAASPEGYISLDAANQILSIGKVHLVNHTDGTLSVARGGTGKTSFSTGQLLFGDLEQDSGLSYSNKMFKLNGFYSDLDSVRHHNAVISNMLEDNKWASPIPSINGWTGWLANSGSSLHGTELDVRYIRQTAEFTLVYQEIDDYATVGDDLLVSLMIKDKQGMNSGGNFTLYTGAITTPASIDVYLDGQVEAPVSTGSDRVELSFPTDGKWHLYEFFIPVNNLSGDVRLGYQLTRGSSTLTEAYVMFHTACLNPSKVRSVLSVLDEDYILRFFKDIILHRDLTVDGDLDVGGNLTVTGDIKASNRVYSDKTGSMPGVDLSTGLYQITSGGTYNVDAREYSVIFVSVASSTTIEFTNAGYVPLYFYVEGGSSDLTISTASGNVTLTPVTTGIYMYWPDWIKWVEH